MWIACNINKKNGQALVKPGRKTDKRHGFKSGHIANLLAMTEVLPQKEEAKLILQRYHVTQAHNLVYNYEELRQLGIQPEFLMAVLEVFEDPRSFDPAKFSHFSLATIIDYLRKTHTYYLKKKLLEIEQSIHLLARAYEGAHPLLILLHHFYSDYKLHLRKHIEEEEVKLIPYIEQLTLAEEKKETLAEKPAYSIADFMSEHHDTEKDLEEIRKTILHYSPPSGNQTLYRILVSQLHVLEKDLAVHALMEDEVLLPRARAIEERVLPFNWQ